ncbi:MAG: CocE/NonD family hydrolase [Acidobacteria bacterium]|nr:CocE/NonD family hydrolase [Acidobacteriota bacterium]
MRDGVKLAARIFLPRTARKEPAPCILEYIPYRKRDLMRFRDEPIHRYFALNGYGSVRVDVRGSGDSGGILRDEYSQAELDDGVEVIHWIAKQPWCDGNVGMMGISWGGFNSLQVAALDPEPLKAIITLCSTDDRYADDAHYMGGCLLNENMQWGSILTMYGAYPPDPEIVGEDQWRAMWHERLEHLEFFAARWMRHPLRDEFWRHGSVCEVFDAIRVPVYAVGGWADGYSNAIPRLLEGLKVPRKGLIGPWAHAFPHDGVPGPAIGFLQEALRWWDRWLRGVSNGIMDEPMFRVWMQESVVPMPQYAIWPGRWVAEKEWPSPRIEPLVYHLGVGFLDREEQQSCELSFSSPATTGLRSGEWCAFGADGEMARDQRPDDGGSLLFDSDVLENEIEILGAPEVVLEVSVDQPVAFLVARLCDVAPDGSSLRVSYGILNLTHREGHDQPELLEPGKWERVRLKLNDTAHSFPEGHRIRLALSTSYWPIIWPPPSPVILTVRTAGSSLSLPSRPPDPDDEKLPHFEPPASAPGNAARKLVHLPMRRTIEVDLSTNEVIYTLKSDGGELDGAALARIDDIDMTVGHQMMKRYRIIENDPLSAQTEIFQRTQFERDGWKIRIVSRSRLSVTAENFQFSCDLEAFENDMLVKERSHVVAIPRHFL